MSGDWINCLTENIKQFNSNDRKELFDLYMNDVNNLLDVQNYQNAHKLKGNSLQLGITPIAEIALNIEQNFNKNYDINSEINKLSTIVKYINEKNIFIL